MSWILVLYMIPSAPTTIKKLLSCITAISISQTKAFPAFESLLHPALFDRGEQTQPTHYNYSILPYL